MGPPAGSLQCIHVRTPQRPTLLQRQLRTQRQAIQPGGNKPKLKSDMGKTGRRLTGGHNIFSIKKTGFGAPGSTTKLSSAEEMKHL